MQSDLYLVSLSLTIAMPKALGSASARGEFSPSTRCSPPLVSIADHAGVGSLQGELCLQVTLIIEAHMM
jgi:hypothetical protein